MDKTFYIYILANKPKGTLYIGITSNLAKRIWEHKNKVIPGFTQKYNLHKLVYFEQYQDAENAIKREKRMKFWRRKWKTKLIENNNPEWKDLYKEIVV